MWNAKIFLKSLNWSLAVSSFVGAALSFVFFSDLWWVGLIVFVVVFILALLLIYFIWLNQKHHKIDSRGSILIEAMYGNILDIRKGKNDNSKPVVVIPFNTSFDTVVEDEPGITDRLIEGDSIHGQWLKKYAKNGSSRAKIDREISEYIEDNGMQPEKHLDEKRGKKDMYKLGSHVFIEKDDCSFLLFGLTEFDVHNHVIKNDDEGFVNLMEILLDVVNKKCAGKHVFIPIMGTKIGMFGINEPTAFEYIRHVVLSKKSILRCSVSIVVFEKVRDKVSIYR